MHTESVEVQPGVHVPEGILDAGGLFGVPMRGTLVPAAGLASAISQCIVLRRVRRLGYSAATLRSGHGTLASATLLTTPPAPDGPTSTYTLSNILLDVKAGTAFEHGVVINADVPSDAERLFTAHVHVLVFPPRPCTPAELPFSTRVNGLPLIVSPLEHA